ncbi:hypothetical protein GCM10008101_16250 [Lysobacter xinjiangensis]|uniref:DUF3253 domain-containing protein n=1 Tax=Cognatilysobacter xinjiangensis TaxID=546892 RepID=A0ABQ3C213_9GAMM|nr:DUF3253 domain-containing protein [Lysobacter xinjiangensis]GGZ62777.1 hypothetical protein GCM10008101_16250 [Lysobacter xinjiangensis]
MADDAAIRDCVVALLRRRADDASICPSEVARALSPDETEWRASMPQVRRVAAAMAESDEIAVTQGERELPSSEVMLAGGPIRLRRGRGFPSEA